VGRGGWTWYTGSAGWLYRIAVENMVGLKVRGNSLAVEPCVSRDWRHFAIHYRFGLATYHVQVENPKGVECGVERMELDGKEESRSAITLVDDGKEHLVRVVMG
jgi:cyclic beta-1,2-glucan synthetase